MKIALTQLNFHVGNFEGNFEKMREYVGRAKAMGADLVVFSELAVCGYPPRDFLEFRDFIDRCKRIIDEMAALADGIAIIVGSPSVNPVKEGKDLFNSAYFLENGRVMDVVHKALLPTYDIFDEYRYFEPYEDFHTISFKGRRIALTICEDLWNVGNENPLYRDCPMDVMIHEQPDLIINISASPFDFKQAERRKGIMKANAERYHVPIFYANQTGAQTEILFDGGSLVLNQHGAVYDEMPYFEEAIRCYELEEVIDSAPETDRQLNPSKMALIHDGLITGIRDYFGKLGFRNAILGLSGGIDSALTLVLAARALGREHVRAILMPSAFSTDHSITDAEKLAQNLGLAYDLIPIHKVYNAILQELHPFFEGKGFDVTEENIQARIRGLYLMALSNKHGYILLNTSNKSEAAVGYGTLYGDMCGGLSVLGDVYKTEVYELSRYINREKEWIPENIIVKAPSAELRHDQRDSDSLPDYAVLDKILYQYIEERRGPSEIIAMGFDEELVRRALKLVNINEYKRFQTPPVLRVSSKAFGMGRRLPIVGKYLS